MLSITINYHMAASVYCKPDEAWEQGDSILLTSVMNIYNMYVYILASSEATTQNVVVCSINFISCQY